MSFILEALKKSEAERRRGEVPALQDNFSSPAPRRRSLWPVLFAAALLLNGAVFGGWLLLRQERTLPVQSSPGELDRIISVPRPEPAKERTMEPPASVPAEPPVTAPASEAVSTPAVPARLPAPIPVDPPVPVALKAAETKADELEVSETPSETPGAAVFREEAADPAPTGPAQGLRPVETEAHYLEVAPERVDPFPLLSELPSDVRSGLPRMNLQLHFFSPEPARRLVRLNGYNLREGDRGGDGLTVVEITPDGIRLSCKGVRFFLLASRR